ncbi:MAG: transglutaminase-like cysteine peptidase [Desulfopila sp.]
MFFPRGYAQIVVGLYRGGLLCFLLLAAAPVFTKEALTISEKTLERVDQQYGEDARQRLLDWQLLIQTTQGDERARLEKVNSFFNETVEFVDDKIHWNVEDYWATPVEFLASKGGDCEDFAIAKFFTLIKLGIPEEKLTLTYVKALRLNQAHMVLTYYPAPGAEPLILDNLVSTILPSSRRTDLLPVYSLNGSGLWLAKQRGKGKLIGHSGRLQRWREMLGRLTQEMEESDEEAP